LVVKKGPALWVPVILMCLLGAMAFAEGEPVIVDVYQGEPVDSDTMMEDLTQVRIVYLGEIHTIADHHRLQEQILEALGSAETPLAMGMEMFSVDQQAIVDSWLKGAGSVDDLLNKLGVERWTNLKDYEAILLSIRKLGIPLVALNAPDHLVKGVAAHGTEHLTAAEKSLIPPDFQKVNPDYDRLLRLRLRVHKAFEHMSLDRIVNAQALRDSVMADAANKFLSSEKGKDRRMVIIAGSGHLNYGFGVPERLQSLNGLSHRIILPSESGKLVLSEEELRQAAPTHITHEDLKFIKTPIADYLYVIPFQQTRVIVKSEG
jgi:uncharacterized iron-regulated protein